MISQRQQPNEKVIEYLRSAIFDGRCGLKDVPELIKRVIREDLWQSRTIPQTRETVEFRQFAEFLQTAPPQGLGTDYQTLGKLCAEDAEALDLLERVKAKRFHGGDRRSASFKRDNITFETSKRGNSIEYSLKRLRKERPDLHQAVLEGKLSAHRAMIEAGFRKQRVQLVRDVEQVSQFIRANFSPSEIKELAALILE